MRRLLAISVLLGSTWLYLPAQSSPVVKSVEPDYGDILKVPNIVVPIDVEILAYPDGRPYSFESFDGALPDHVIKALSQYRMAKSPKGSLVKLTLPVRQVLADFGAASPFTGPSSEAAEVATALDAEGAAKMERELTPSKKLEREILLTYAATHNDAGSKQMRVRLLEWMIRNDPKADVLLTSVALIPKADDPAGYETVKALWQARVASDTTERRFIERAAHFMSLSEPIAARDLLRPVAGTSLRLMERYGALFGRAALGVTAIDPLSAQVITAGPELPSEGFGASAQSQLLIENQLPLLMSAFQAMNISARDLQALSSVPKGYTEFCNRLRARIIGIKPNFDEPCETNAPVIRTLVSNDVMRGKLKSQRRPTYPREARNMGVQGTVLLSAVIGADGRMKWLAVIKGPFALLEESVNAVREWRYTPQPAQWTTGRSPHRDRSELHTPMKAVQFHDYGEPSVLCLEDVPEPKRNREVGVG